MKKLLLSLMAVAAMASCVKEQTLQTPEKMAISFSEFVNNSNTKAAIDPTFNNGNTPLNAFYVWGFMTSNTGVVFDKELVSRADAQSAWTYQNLAYWAPGRSYKFAALAPVNNDKIEVTLAAGDGKYLAADGSLGKVKFTNVDGTVDVLYAEDEVVTPSPLAADPEKVELTFAHLLSKIKFTFTNGLVSENNKIVVSDVKMIVPAVGTVDLTVSPYSWVVEGQTVALDFGKAIDKTDATNDKLAVTGKGEVEYERLTIPIATTSSIISSYEVSFNVTIYNGDQVAQTIPMTSTINGTSFLPGKCYNLTATLTAENLGLQVIEFTATVEDWVDAGELGFLN